MRLSLIPFLPNVNPTYWFVNSVIKVGTNALCRIDAPDLQKVPMRGPLIIIANHTGQLEVPLIFAHLQPRPITGWAKIETWDILFLDWLFTLWGVIPIRRGAVDTNAMRKALMALDKGYILGIAPEGTRNKTGRLIRAHPGVVALALHSKASILPLAHWGGESFYDNLKRLKRTEFHIRVGEPFRLKAGGGKVTNKIRQQIADEMMGRLAALLPPDYRGEYTGFEESTQSHLETIVLQY